MVPVVKRAAAAEGVEDDAGLEAVLPHHRLEDVIIIIIIIIIIYWAMPPVYKHRSASTKQSISHGVSHLVGV